MTSILEEKLPSSEQLRKRYAGSLRRAINARAINISAMAAKVGTTQSNMTKILNSSSYPSRKLHKRINEFLDTELVYVSKYALTIKS